MPVPDSASRLAPVAVGRSPRAEDGASASWIRARPNARRLLAVSEANWEPATVDGRAVFLPILVPLELRPGAHGVTTRDANEPADISARKATRIAEDRGLQVLPSSLKIAAEHLPASVEPGPYIREYDCREHRDAKPGLHYREAWDLPIATPAGEWQAFRFDRVSFNRWRLHLVESGVVARPAPLVAERLQDDAARRLARVESASYADPRRRESKSREAAERAALVAAASEAA